MKRSFKWAKWVCISLLLALAAYFAVLPIFCIFYGVVTAEWRTTEVATSFRDIDPASQDPEDLNIIRPHIEDPRFELDRARVVSYRAVTSSNSSAKQTHYHDAILLVRHRILDAEALSESRKQVRYVGNLEDPSLKTFSLTFLRKTYKLPYPDWWPDTGVSVGLFGHNLDKSAGHNNDLSFNVDFNNPEYRVGEYRLGSLLKSSK